MFFICSVVLCSDFENHKRIMPLSSRKQTITDYPYIENTSTMQLVMLKDEKSPLLLTVLERRDKIVILVGRGCVPSSPHPWLPS